MCLDFNKPMRHKRTKHDVTVFGKTQQGMYVVVVRYDDSNGTSERCYLSTEENLNECIENYEEPTDLWVILRRTATGRVYVCTRPFTTKKEALYHIDHPADSHVAKVTVPWTVFST